MTARRHTVHDLLAEVAGAPPAAVPADVLHELRADLDRLAAELAPSLPADARPLRVPKDRLAAVLACERHVLATLGGRPPAEPMVLGAALDHVVTRHVLHGVGVDPAAEAAREALRVTGSDEALAWWDAQPPEVDARLRGELDRAAELLAAGWGEVDPGWWARPQVDVSVVLAGGVVVCAGRFDLLLGGPPTGRPGVLVEVKSGRARPAHRDDLLWYALLTGLRFGWAPAVVATWSAADDALVPVPVSEGALRAAARRAGDGLVALAGLAAGRPPQVRAGPRCGWCPELDRCEVGRAGLARHDDRWDDDRWDDDEDDDGA